MSSSKRDRPVQEAPTEWRKILMEEGPNGQMRPKAIDNLSRRALPQQDEPTDHNPKRVRTDVPQEWEDILHSEPAGSSNHSPSISLQSDGDDFSERTIPGFNISQLFETQGNDAVEVQDHAESTNEQIGDASLQNDNANGMQSTMEGFPFAEVPEEATGARRPPQKPPANIYVPEANDPSTLSFNPPPTMGMEEYNAEAADAHNGVLAEANETYMTDAEHTSSEELQALESIDAIEEIHAEDLLEEEIHAELIEESNEDLSHETVDTPGPSTRELDSFEEEEVALTADDAVDAAQHAAIAEVLSQQGAALPPPTVDKLQQTNPVSSPPAHMLFAQPPSMSPVSNVGQPQLTPPLDEAALQQAFQQGQMINPMLVLQQQTLELLGHIAMGVQQQQEQYHSLEQRVEDIQTKQSSASDKSTEHFQTLYTLLQDLLVLYDFVELRFRSLWEAHGEHHPIVIESRSVREKLIDILKRQGLQAIDTSSLQFDANYHRVLQEIPTNNPKENEKITRIFRQGFIYKDQIFRPTEVEIKRYQP